MNIGKFSVNNPVFLNILMVALLALGSLSLLRMPREQFSEVPFFWVNIVVPYPGVAAEDIEELITIPIENEMQGLDKLKQIKSVSQEGLASVQVEFDSGISQNKFDKLFQEVRTRFSKVSLPEEALDGSIDDFSSNDFLPVIELVLYGDNKYEALNLKAKRLKEKISQIKDVSSVTIIGQRDKQIFINSDPYRLESYGIPLSQVVQAVQNQNQTIPGGTLNKGDDQYLVRTITDVKTEDDINKIIVSRSQNSAIEVKDIGDVQFQYDPEGVKSRYNGQEALTLRVAKVPKGNSLKIVEELRSILEGETFSSGVRAVLQNDSTLQIKSSIDVLVNNALTGLILLVLILFVFVGLRNSLITALGIPITFGVTFLILDLTGETFNSNTLFALVLVLGLIVDHAIVIIENSFRLEEEGLKRKEAAILGTNQVVLPVIAATATTVAAFIPLMILPGTIGRFLRVIPLTVSIALVVSTLEALFFIPSHYADWPGGRRKKKGKNHSFFSLLQRGYKKSLTFLYGKRKITVPLLFILLIGIFSLGGRLGQDLFSAEDFSVFYIDIELPTGSSLEKTENFILEYEKKILPLIGQGNIDGYNSFIGFRGESSGNTVKGNIGQIVVDLKEQSERTQRSIPIIMAEVKELTKSIPGAEQVLFRRATNGPPTAAPIGFRLFSDSYSDLRAVSALIEEELLKNSDLFNLKDNFEEGTPEIRILVDSERASRFSLNPVSVGLFIRASVEGIKASTIFLDNEEIDIRVGFFEGRELSVSSLSELKIRNNRGEYIPLSSFCTLEQGRSLASIKRIDGKRELSIESETYNPDGIRQVNQDIKTYFNRVIAPSFPDVRLSVGGEFAEFNDLLFQIGRIFLIGIFLIYLILGSQFNSYSQPFIILLTVPFAFAGIILYLFVSNTPFSTTVLYAAVALAGIAVNDSIVLISFINEQREAGLSIKESVLQGGVTRLRPILLTSLTTIAGLLPTALGFGGTSVVWGPMASTIIFGLIFSTITALIVIPCLYGVLYDKKKKK